MVRIKKKGNRTKWERGGERNRERKKHKENKGEPLQEVIKIAHYQEGWVVGGRVGLGGLGMRTLKYITIICA